MARDYSDLEVVHGPAADAPVVVQEEKISYMTLYGASAHDWEAKARMEPPTPKRRTCGVEWTRRNICLLVVGIVLLVGGVAGGVVGGLLLSRANQNASRPASKSPIGDTPSSSASTSASASAPASVSTLPSSTTAGGRATLTTSTEVVGPTQTLYRDCPSSNNTVYRGAGSDAFQFRVICGASYKQPHANVVNQKAASLRDCVDLCVAYNISNKTAIASGLSSPCNSVCWRNSATDPDWPGQCFGSTTLNSTAGFQYNDESICDSGAWINQNFGL